MGNTALREWQLGWESTYGTAVDATRILYPGAGSGLTREQAMHTPNVDAASYDEARQGRQRLLVEAGGSLTDVPLDTNMVIDLLRSAINPDPAAGTQIGATGAYTWEFEPGVGTAYNLLTANQSNAETDTTGITALSNTTRSRSTDQAWEGSASHKAVCDNIGAEEGIETANVTTTVSEWHTAAVYVYGASGTVELALIERTAADALVGETVSSPATLAGAWQRIQVSREFGATGARARLQVRTDVQQGITFYVDGLQITQHEAAPPWIVGGGTPSGMTVEFDSSGQKWRGTGVVVDELSFSWAVADPITLGASLISQDTGKISDLTTGLSAFALLPLMGWEVQLFIGDIDAADPFDASLLKTGTLIGGEVTISNNRQRLYRGNNTQLLYAIGRGKRRVEASLTLDLGTNAMTEWDNWSAGTQRVVGLRFGGNVQAGSDEANTHRVDIALPGVWTATPVGDQDESSVLNLTMENIYSTDQGHALQVTVVNTRAA